MMVYVHLGLKFCFTLRFPGKKQSEQNLAVRITSSFRVFHQEINTEINVLSNIMTKTDMLSGHGLFTIWLPSKGHLLV